MDTGFSLWTNPAPERAQGATPKTPRSGQILERQFQELLLKATSEHSGSAEWNGGGLVRLGKLTKQNPTVSHLLVQHREYGKQCWDIVHDPINSEKPFRDMAKGETVWLDPQSNEIVAGKDASVEQNPTSGSPFSPAQETVSELYRREGPRKSEMHTASTENLNQTVASYCGTPYSRLDCYELVVQGLKDMGVNYFGRDGLQHELMQKAQREECASNAYLTGEGLIRSLGSPVFQQNLSETTHPEAKAKDLMHSLKDRLEPGMILSLSTQDRGHTGVISRKEGKWTFINSGNIQHAVDGSDVDRGVAEEDLHSELREWLERAQERDQCLSVSIGKLSPEKVARYLAPGKRLSNTA